MTRILRVSLITLGDPERQSGGYLYHLRMAESAAANRAQVRFASAPDRPFPLPSLSAGSVMREVRAQRPDVVVLDSIAAAFVAPALALGRAAAAPVVGSLHQPPGGIDHATGRAAAQRLLDRLAYRRTRLLIAASDALADELAAEGLPRGRIRVVPPGRDVAAGTPTGTAAGPGDLRRGRAAALLCVANWVERKGILDVLEALARLPEPAATLHLVGDDRADPRYAARVRARLTSPDLAGRVVVHGIRSRAEVAALYRAADAFVLPSTREPYGTVWGEAMAEGLPVVGWRAGNLPHLAEHDREALLVPPGDRGGLAQALARIAADEPLRRRLGAAARARAGARPTWAESAELFFGVLREALQRPDNGSPRG